MLAQLKADFPEDLRVVYRHFPLVNIHSNAVMAAQAAEAAGAQGQFWAMHDVLFDRLGEWASLSDAEFQEWLAAQAAELGLDGDRFTEDLLSEAIQTKAEQSWEFGLEQNLPGTPYLIINGEPYGGPLDYGNLAIIIKLYILRERQFAECPPMEIDPAGDYFANLETEKGEIVLQLYADKAPLAVNSFIFLARQGWFDGVSFHRVIPSFVAQAGDPSGTGFGGPGYAFDNEIAPDLRFDREGVLGMANAGPGSNGSQFFITFAPQPELDGKYTIFGEVVSGMEVLQALAPRDPQSNPNHPPGDIILKVTIVER